MNRIKRNQEEIGFALKVAGDSLIKSSSKYLLNAEELEVMQKKVSSFFIRAINHSKVMEELGEI